MASNRAKRSYLLELVLVSDIYSVICDPQEPQEITFTTNSRFGPIGQATSLHSVTISILAANYIYYMQDTNMDRFSNRNVDQTCLNQLS